MTYEKVMKFGGAALADGPAVQRACRIVRELGGPRAIVVVSAHQGVTGLLEEIARSAVEGRVDAERVRIRHRTLLRQLGLDPELLDRYFAELQSLLGEIARRGSLLPGERDLVLSHGERMSARIVAHELKKEGANATPVDAFDLGLLTDSNHGAARPLAESAGAVRAALLQIPGIPVVTGFLARDRHGNLTTLGRNGSDLTAAILAEAVGAKELELWKAVGGMMTADPAIVPEARVIARLSFEEATELALNGAEVLHPEALAPAQRGGIAVRFLDVHDPKAPGSALHAGAPPGGLVGIAARRRLMRIRMLADESGAPAESVASLASALARHGVEPAVLSASVERVEAFVAPGPPVDDLLREIGRRASVEKDLALVALVGRTTDDEDESNPIATLALSSLSRAGIRVRDAILGTRRASQLFLVAAADLEGAVRGLHADLLAPQGTRVP